MALILSGTDGVSDVDGTAAAPAVRGTDTNTGMFFPAADTIAFAEGGVEAMRLDSAGNVGLGFVPSAWFANSKALQIGQGSAVEGRTNDSSNITVGGNYYLDSAATYRYVTSNFSQRYTQAAGTHLWYTAPSGTAGNAISFTQAMTLNASGQLIVGATSDLGGIGAPLNASNASAGYALALQPNTVSDRTGIYMRSTTEGRIGWDTSGYLSFFNGSTERARITSGGDLLVGTTSGSGRIRMKQSADAHSGTFTIENFGNTNTWSFLIGSDNNLYFGYNGTSRGVFNNSTGAYTTISDRSLKKDIAEIQYGLNSVLALRPVSYLMKDQEESASKTLGFIAQEVDEVVPESVFQMRDDFYGMDKEALIPVLVKAIQEQQAIITALTARVSALEGK